MSDRRSIKGTTPMGTSMVYDYRWVARHLGHIAAMLRPEDVWAVTIHREDGDHFYEWAEGTGSIPKEGNDGR